MKTLWGTLFAIGTILPGLAQAQDMNDQRPRRERPENADGRIDRREPRARADDGEQAPTARPDREGGRGREDRAQPAVQPGFQQTPLARPDRDGGRGREDRAQPAVQPSPQQAPRSADNGAWRGQQRDEDRSGSDDAQRNLARDRGESRGRNRGEQIFQPRPDRIDERVENDRRDRSTLRSGDYAGRGAGRGDDRADRGGFGRDDRRRQFDRSGTYGRDHARDDDRFDDRRAWNRGWRNDARYDWSRNRAIDRSAYSLPRYYAPGGWGYGYRRFSVGVTLWSGLFGENYWIDDPRVYRLPPAYGPYRWVRYYGDALLVDVRTGQVVDTVYDIFG